VDLKKHFGILKNDLKIRFTQIYLIKMIK
jgi:hypothetical protein